MLDGMLAFSYLRMSSAGQIQGDSQRRQFEAAQAYAERNGLTMAPPLKDLGVSAFRGRNRRSGALATFVNGVKEGKLEPGVLVIEALDRLSREQPMRILGLMEEILDTGCSIHLLSTGQTISADSIGKQRGLLSTIALFAELAHHESVQKSERITAANLARQERAREGKRSKGAYCPPWFKRTYHKSGEVEYTAIPEVVASIRRIFELASTGMGAMSIARTLNAEGATMVPAKFGESEAQKERTANRKWYQSYVGLLLKDRRVLGEYQPTRTERATVRGEETIKRKVPNGDPVIGFFEPIITQEAWDAAQIAADPKLGRKVGGRNAVFANLFTAGMAVCNHCESNMLLRAVYKKGTKAKMPYLRCSNAQKGVTCDNVAYARVDWFESKVLAALPGVPWSTLIKNIPVMAETTKVTEKIEAVAAKIDKLSQSSARLLNILERSDEIDQEIIDRRRGYQDEITSLKKRKVVLERDRQALLRNASVNPEAVDEAAALVQLMWSQTGAELFATRQKLHTTLKQVIEVIRFDNVGFENGAGRSARVYIRGGMMLTVPLDKETPPTAGFTMGGHRDYIQQVERSGIPRLTVSDDGTRIVEKTTAR